MGRHASSTHPASAGRHWRCRNSKGWVGRCSTRLLRDSTERRCGAFTSGLGHSGVSVVWASAVTCGGVTGDASTVAAEDPFQRFAVTCGNLVEDASTVAAEDTF